MFLCIAHVPAFPCAHLLARRLVVGGDETIEFWDEAPINWCRVLSIHGRSNFEAGCTLASAPLVRNAGLGHTLRTEHGPALVLKDGRAKMDRRARVLHIGHGLHALFSWASSTTHSKRTIRPQLCTLNILASGGVTFLHSMALVRQFLLQALVIAVPWRMS